MPLPDIISNTNSLRKFELIGGNSTYRIDNDSVPLICHSLRENVFLTEININSNSLGNLLMKQILDSVGNKQAVKILRLAANRLDSSIIPTIMQFKNLVELDVSENYAIDRKNRLCYCIRPDGIQLLATHHELRKLHLGKVWLDDIAINSLLQNNNLIWLKYENLSPHSNLPIELQLQTHINNSRDVFYNKRKNFVNQVIELGRMSYQRGMHVPTPPLNILHEIAIFLGNELEPNQNYLNETIKLVFQNLTAQPPGQRQWNTKRDTESNYQQTIFSSLSK